MNNLDKAIKITEKVLKIGNDISPCTNRLLASLETLSVTEETCEVALTEGRYALKYKKNFDTKTALPAGAVKELSHKLTTLVSDLNADCRVVRAHLPSKKAVTTA